MPWYKQLEKWLLPTRPAVTWALIAIIAVSVYMLFSKSNSLRTLWAAYVISP